MDPMIQILSLENALCILQVHCRSNLTVPDVSELFRNGFEPIWIRIARKVITTLLPRLWCCIVAQKINCLVGLERTQSSKTYTFQADSHQRQDDPLVVRNNTVFIRTHAKRALPIQIPCTGFLTRVRCWLWRQFGDFACTRCMTIVCWVDCMHSEIRNKLLTSGVFFQGTVRIHDANIVWIFWLLHDTKRSHWPNVRAHELFFTHLDKRKSTLQSYG